VLPGTRLSYLITGGTGSLGQALTRRFLASPDTSRVIVYSRSEKTQAAMRAAIPDPRLEFHLGDVTNRRRLRRSFRAFPDVVIHAAAMKRIEACEAQPDEAYRANVEGTRNVCEAACDFNIERVLVISSDKSCESVTTYGATKALAENLALRWEALKGWSSTRIAVLRWGNCWDSDGAVLHAFRAAKASGGRVSLTHPDMTRFWWSVADAAAFVETVRDRMGHAQVWVPKIGAARLVDLLESVYPNAPADVTGLRGIEKLHEVMVSADESRVCYELPDSYVLAPTSYSTIPEGATRVPDGFRYASDTAPAADLREVASPGVRFFMNAAAVRRMEDMEPLA
jgi:UDP-N-acetylglucosamine 4,6-dehydratase